MNVSKLLSIGVIGGFNYSLKVRSIFGSSLVAYWPLNETSGTTITDASGNGRTGTYSNVTLGQAGIGDGNTAAGFVPASSSWGNVQSTGLASAFNGATGTIAGWFLVSAAGIWTDGAGHNIINLLADANNNVSFQKYTTNTQLRFTRKAGGSQSNVIANSSSPAGWTHIAMTWDTGANQFIAYLAGAQFGTTQTCPGTFTGSIVTSEIGRQSASTYWSGSLAHCGIASRVLSAAEIARLATI